MLVIHPVKRLTMKVLTCLLLAAVAHAQKSGIDKTASRTVHSHILGKAFEQRQGESQRFDSYHNRLQKKFQDRADGVEREPQQKKKKERSPRSDMDPEDRILKKSKKSSKSSKDSRSNSSSSSSSNDTFRCTITVTNLHAFQQFEDFLVLIHSNKLDYPIFTLGEPAISFERDSDDGDRNEIDNGLKELADDGDTDDMEDFYEDEGGVYDVDDINGPLNPGVSVQFTIEYTETYDELSIASSMLFSNDAFIGIDALSLPANGAFFLNVLDAGVEPNIGTCWSVKADERDFPGNSDCADDDSDGNDNENDIGPGEGFVHVHTGIYNFDDDAFDDYLENFSCNGNDADSFAEYFSNIGYNDDTLINIGDDQLFISFVNAGDYDDDLIELAGRSDDLNDFCDAIENALDDIFDQINDIDTRMEAELFDWRNPVLLATLACDGPSSSSSSSS